MFAINHAATGLVIKKAYPHVPMVWILLSVQVMELVWILLNYLGVERTTTEDEVTYVGDIHLAHMPYSHSLATMIGAAVIVWLIGGAAGRADIGLAMGIGILSHLLLDLITHSPDLPPAPGLSRPKLGLGLYARYPATAFWVEIGYGALCWWIYRGSLALLIVILAFNLANLPMFSRRLGRVLHFLSHRPKLITTVILLQIVITLALVGALSR